MAWPLPVSSGAAPGGCGAAWASVSGGAAAGLVLQTVLFGASAVQEKTERVIVTGTADAPKRTVWRTSPAAAPPETAPAAQAAPQPPVAAPEQTSSSESAGAGEATPQP